MGKKKRWGIASKIGDIAIPRAKGEGGEKMPPEYLRP